MTKCKRRGYQVSQPLNVIGSLYLNVPAAIQTNVFITRTEEASLPSNSNLTRSYSIKLLLAIVKKCIATKWKSDLPEPTGLWLSEVNNRIPLENITYLLRNKMNIYYKI